MNFEDSIARLLARETTESEEFGEALAALLARELGDMRNERWSLLSFAVFSIPWKCRTSANNRHEE
jgi:hypothetical protein